MSKLAQKNTAQTKQSTYRSPFEMFRPCYINLGSGQKKAVRVLESIV